MNIHTRRFWQQSSSCFFSFYITYQFYSSIYCWRDFYCRFTVLFPCKWTKWTKWTWMTEQIFDHIRSCLVMFGWFKMRFYFCNLLTTKLVQSLKLKMNTLNFLLHYNQVNIVRRRHSSQVIIWDCKNCQMRSTATNSASLAIFHYHMLLYSLFSRSQFLQSLSHILYLEKGW